MKIKTSGCMLTNSQVYVPMYFVNATGHENVVKFAKEFSYLTD